MAVSPEDISPNTRDRTDPYILVNNQFVFTARPLQGFPRGQISLSDAHRNTARIAMTDIVNVELYDPFSEGNTVYMMSMDVNVSFAGRRTTDQQLDQDKLSEQVTRIYQNQIFAPGQQFLFDYQSYALRLEVKSTEVGNGDVMQQGQRIRDRRGILTTQTTINFFKSPNVTGPQVNIAASISRPAANALIQPDFKFEDMGIGGLDTEFKAIFRRAFASRVYPPGLMTKLGMKHVKGILLYGPPGTGKTLIARKIGQMFNAESIKVINGPEVLNKYVGASEENIRKLFAEAEKDQKEKGEESGLHLIIFDELDAVCKQRGSGAGGGTGVGDSVVNQLLSKLDGVEQLNNILLIGMTNRKDMIDDALLRPGRLELHVEISLPDEKGRQQILDIHTARWKGEKRLAPDVDIAELARLTKNFSGAEIEGLVRAASSYAMNRHIKAGTMASLKDDFLDMSLTMLDFMRALEEVKPAFGVNEESLADCFSSGIIHYSPTVGDILHQGEVYVEGVRASAQSNLLPVLIYGPPRSGKSALAAKMALDSGSPFIRLVSGADMIGYSESGKVAQLSKVFADAYKSTMSIIVLDAIEKLVSWSPIGPRFSNEIVNTLSYLLSRKPPPGRRLLILATTSHAEVLDHLQLSGEFAERIAVPYLSDVDELIRALVDSKAFGGDRRMQEEAVSRIGGVRLNVGIKDVLIQVDLAMHSEDPVRRFADKIVEISGRGE